MRNRFAWLASQLALVLIATPFFVCRPLQADEGYPLRAKYANLRVITTEELANHFDNSIIVDVRSKVEYDVIHIKGAIHLPVSSVNFVHELQELRKKEGAAKKIVLYCNGHTCAKSYEAAEKAEKGSILNTTVYDSGVFDWIKAHPDQGVMFGKTPVDRSKLLADSELKAKSLSAKEFLAKANDPNSIVIDVRDPIQRKEIPSIKGLRNIPMDELVKVLEQKRLKETGKTLLFLDAVGHQNQWLQYYLEKFGYTDYSFLSGGVASLK